MLPFITLPKFVSAPISGILRKEEKKNKEKYKESTKLKNLLHDTLEALDDKSQNANAKKHLLFTVVTTILNSFEDDDGNAKKKIVSDTINMLEREYGIEGVTNYNDSYMFKINKNIATLMAKGNQYSREIAKAILVSATDKFTCEKILKQCKYPVPIWMHTLN